MSINWSTKKWGNLQISPNQTIPSNLTIGSHKKLNFLCSCGRTYPMIVKNVTSGVSSSCGHCNNFSKEYWLRQTWGKLRLDPNQGLLNGWSKCSSNPHRFLCSCGRTTTIPFYYTAGNLQSCGKCNWRSKEYWLSQKWGKLVLDPNQELPNEWAPQTEMKSWFLCDCGVRHLTSFSYVTTGGTKSCGCISPGTSTLSPAYEIYEYVKSLVPDAIFSYWLLYRPYPASLAAHLPEPIKTFHYWM